MHRLALLALFTACAGQSPVSSSERGKGPAEVVPTTALAAGLCDDAPLLTVAELAEGKGDRERIAIDAVPEVQGFCTLLACEGGGCCNNCGGNYGLRVAGPPELEVYFEGLAGCGGMDCNFHCEPFGTKPSSRYRFVGTNTFEPAGVTAVYGKASFKIEKYCRL